MHDVSCMRMSVARACERGTYNLTEFSAASSHDDDDDGFSSGEDVQRISVINSLPQLLTDNNVDCMQRIVPKIRVNIHAGICESVMCPCYKRKTT